MKKKKHKISFREVKDSDRPYLLYLYDSTREDVRIFGAAMTPVEKASFIEMQFCAQDIHYKKYYPDADYLIIRSNGKDVGRLYREERESEIRVIDITIDPEHRSKGIGFTIMSQIIDEAFTKQKDVGIHVMKNNRAMNLYSRLGFNIVGDSGVYHLMVYKNKTERKLHQDEKELVPFYNV